MRLPDPERIAKIQRLAREGTAQQKARARLYLSVLLPAMKRRKKGDS